MQYLKPDIKDLLHSGAFIPAHPLALNEDRTLDEVSQKMLTHYYIDSGVDGIAVGVHTTQFEIREFGLYEKVLKLAVDEIKFRNLKKPFIKIAGVAGPTEQAIKEAKIAQELGYDLVLLSMGGLPNYTEQELINHAKELSKIMPICGFYLQPSAGGRIFSEDFWTQYVEIENVVAFKTAPFNRYQTLDVIKAVLRSDRRDEIALYTGNDDNIIADLLSSYSLNVDGIYRKKEIVGGLLGHWSVWTHKAVEIFREVKKHKSLSIGYDELLELGTHITDTNGAFFDVKNNFKGCIAGVNEVLRRQGMLKGNWCLLENEALSEGQSEYIDEVYRQYANLNDDKFVKENIDIWKNYATRHLK